MIEVWLARIEAPGLRDTARWSTRAPGVRDRRASSRDALTASRLLARAALAATLGVPAADVRLARRCPVCGGTDHGRPFVPEHPGAPRFSISRTAGLVGVALCPDADVGLDLERVADLPSGAAEAILGPEEAGGSPTALATRWVRKEAALKASGHGLAADPRGVVVSDPGRPARVLSWPVGGPVPRLEDLRLPRGFVGCVAGLDAAYSPVRVSFHSLGTAGAQLDEEGSNP